MSETPQFVLADFLGGTLNNPTILTRPSSGQTGSVALYAVLAMVLFAAGIYAGLAVFKPPSAPQLATGSIDGIYFSEPKSIIDFELISDNGAAYEPSDLKGHWSFLYFGYTFCPDVCPLTLAQLSQVASKLDEQSTATAMRYLLISVDPARDTPDRLAAYTKSFGPKFQGVSGEKEQLDKLTKDLGVYYKIHPPESGQDFYLVDHSSTLYLINPDGKLQAIFTPPFTPAGLTEDFLTVQRGYRADS